MPFHAPPHDLDYKTARARLIRAGFRPLRLQHDIDDACWRSGFCKWYPEALNCGGSLYMCDFVFERPGARHLPPAKRYLLIHTGGEPIEPERNAEVLYAGPPTQFDLHVIWQRKDLKHRGCGNNSIEFRYCPDSDFPDRDPRLMGIPPLPPSLR